MRKTWNRVIIITWFLIALLGAAGFFFLMPYFKTWQVFRTIDKGGWDKITGEYGNLSESEKEMVDRNLPAYSAFIAKEYVEGERTFIYTAAAFDAIGLIDSTGLQAQYMPDIAKNEYISAVLDMVNLAKSYDVSAANEAQKRIDSASARLDLETREQIMTELLNINYPLFLNGQMSEIRLTALCDFVKGNAMYDAKDYAADIENNVKAILEYRKLYEDAEKYYEDNNFFQVYNICENVQVDPLDKLYEEKFSRLWTRADIAGKDYYMDELDSYIATGDKVNAAALMARLEDYFGDDINLEDARVKIAEDWQRTYIDVMEHMDVIIRSNNTDAEGKQIISDEDMKKLEPDRMLLMDMQGDGVPELILFNSKKAKDSTTPCFFFNFKNKRYGYLGLYSVTHFTGGSQFVYSMVGGDNEETILYDYNGTSIDAASQASKEGDTYIVNGAEATDVDYLAERDDIINHASETGRSFENASPTDKYVSYILAYGTGDSE